MQLQIIDEAHVRLIFDDEENLAVAGEPFGALQMLAASLALCTASVLEDYATTARFHLHSLAIDVAWSYADQPYRVGDMRMTLQIGSDVPASRHKALLRAAEHCTVHSTLKHGATVETTLEVVDAEQA